MARLFEVDSHVRSMIDEDGAVLLDLRAGKYYSLNGVAANVWTRAEKGLDKNVILEQLATLYGVSEDQIQTDVDELVSGLEKKGLVHVAA